MTAPELYEIVKDVPREAWPEQLMFSKRRKVFTNEMEPVPRWDLVAEWAELAFIGSMTAWLAGKFETVIYRHNESAAHTVSQDIKEWEGDSLVAALAAACKEAA